MVSESKSKKRETISIFLALISLALYILVDYFKTDFVALSAHYPFKVSKNIAFYIFAFPLKITIGAISLKIAGEKFTQIKNYVFSYLICIFLYIFSIRIFYVKAFTECLYYLVNVPILEFHFLIALTLKNRLGEKEV